MKIIEKMKAAFKWIDLKLMGEASEVSLAVENLIQLLKNHPRQFVLTSYEEEPSAVFIEIRNRDLGQNKFGDFQNCASIRLEPTDFTLAMAGNHRVELNPFERMALLPVIRAFVREAN